MFKNDIKVLINLSLLSELLSIPTFAEIESEMENIDPLKIYKTIDELNHLFGTKLKEELYFNCLLYTSPSPRDPVSSRMPSSA